MNERTCSKCGRTLPIDRFRVFVVRKTGKRVVNARCAECKQAQVNVWKARNKDRNTIYRKRHNALHAERYKQEAVKAKQRTEARRHEQQEAMRIESIRQALSAAMLHVRNVLIPQGEALRQGKVICTHCKRAVRKTNKDGWCRDCLNASARKYRRTHKDKIKVRQVIEYARLKANPHEYMVKRMRSRIATAMKRYAKGYTKTGSTMQYLGCTAAELCRYIESMFKPRMTWQNYGKAWHLDHVIPCASFDLTQEHERHRAFHYTNLQPLWAKENIRKSDNMPTNGHQPGLLI
jgi:hypothetical protein